jgi:CDP-glycerol glycerophosphotransferase (TagB/SpsB family)/SAM-dependent methyltransferase
VKPFLEKLNSNSRQFLDLNENFVSQRNRIRAKSLKKFIQKVENQEYITEPQPCICDGTDSILLAEIDRYGLPLKTVLCTNCGLLRSDPYYTEKTLESFYQKEYRSIYTGKHKPTELFFENQEKIGEKILQYLGPDLNPSSTIYEIGAGSGGILSAFQKKGHHVKGCDIGINFLEYGKKNNIDLYEGDFRTLLKFEKADLLILNHVLEHVKDPVGLLTDIKELLKPNGKVFIGLPGVLFFPLQYNSKFLFYIQNAHCYNYCLQTLQFTAGQAGLSLVRGDERIMSIFTPGVTSIAPIPDTASMILDVIARSQKNFEKTIKLGKYRKLFLRNQKHPKIVWRNSAVVHRKILDRANRKSKLITELKIDLNQSLTDLNLSRKENDFLKVSLDDFKTKYELESELTHSLKEENDLLSASNRLKTRTIKKQKKTISKIQNSLGWKYILFQRRFLKKIGLWKVVLSILSLFVSIRKWIRKDRRKYWHFFFKLLPIKKNDVFFESHRGLSYSDNPKAICEALLRRQQGIRCIWSLQDPRLKVPEDVIVVKRFSRKYYYHLARSRVLVHNAEFAQKLPIRKKQIYINTQHGTPLKLMGTDIIHKSNIDIETYSKNTRWSWLISPNRYTTEIFKRVYLYDGPVLEVGYPRNDIFYQRSSSEDVMAIRNELGLPLDRKIILYAPTWRDIGIKRTDRTFKLHLELDELYESLGDTHVIILRLHHLILSILKIDQQYQGFVYEFSAPEYDIQELMLVSDILITDYSSVMFDFCNTQKPIIFYTYDLDEYSSQIRGTYFDLPAHAPGPLVRTSAELLNAIRNIDLIFPEYSEKRRAFYDKFCSLENGNASDTIVEQIILPAIKTL